MPKTSYISIDGMLFGEVTDGVMRNYGTDALGSVVETVLNGIEENTYQYKPYGGTLAKTGTAADPSFPWLGGSGYKATKLSDCETYVRMRHLAQSQGRWTSLDPLWPNEPAYAHASDAPNLLIDPSGLYTTDCCCDVKVTNVNGALTNVMSDPQDYPRDLTPQCRSAFRCASLSYTYQLAWSYIGQNGTQCNAYGFEQLYANGVLRVSQNWNGKLQQTQWLNCLDANTPQQGCPSILKPKTATCTITDCSGAVPCTKPAGKNWTLSLPFTFQGHWLYPVFTWEGVRDMQQTWILC